MYLDRRRFLALAATPAIPVPLDLDVPFIVTPDNAVLKMLDLAQVSSGDHVLDLGSGDGRIVITAALRYGASASGVEVDPALVERARSNALKAGVASRTNFEVRDLFATDLSRASVITMYLLPDVNIQLRPALLQLRPGTRLISHDWDMGDWSADQQATVDAPDKTIGLLKKAKLMLWIVPANVDGLHRGQIEQRAEQRVEPQGDGIELKIVQRYQQISMASLQFGGRTLHALPAPVLGPSVTLHGADEAGKRFRLSASVRQQPTVPAAGAIRWRLLIDGEPQREIATQLVR